MRRSTRTSLMALIVAIPALAAAGCGGGQVSADEVPGPPPALTVPSDNDIGGSGSGSSNSSSSSEDSSSGSSDGSTDSGADSGTADSGTADGGTTTTPPADEGGGTAAPEATAAPDTATNDQQPAPGSPPEQFENFCEQNAGAC
jgi:hypothetical protein